MLITCHKDNKITVINVDFNHELKRIICNQKYFSFTVTKRESLNI